MNIGDQELAAHFEIRLADWEILKDFNRRTHRDYCATVQGLFDATDFDDRKDIIVKHVIPVLKSLAGAPESLKADFWIIKFHELEDEFYKLLSAREIGVNPKILSVTQMFQNDDQNATRVKQFIQRTLQQTELPNDLVEICSQCERSVQNATILETVTPKLVKEISLSLESLPAQIEEFRKLQNKADRAEKKITEIAGQASQVQARITYGNLRDKHTKRQNWWLWVLIVGFTCLVAIVIWIARLDATDILGTGDSNQSTGKAIFLIFQKSLFVSAVLILIKVALNKYNAERQLDILYSHRIAAIDQLDITIDSLGAISEEAKAQFRLEMGKMILSDPATNYSTGENHEINFSPVFAAADKLGQSK